MAIDVTDETFQTDVIDRSASAAVVVDLWAEWCGPCRTLGPTLEKVIGETDGVELVKVDVDANPAISQAFRVQSIPAVYALKNGEVVDGFMGAVGEQQVREFVERLVPTEAESAITALVAAGDEASLRQAFELEPANEDVIVALADLLVEKGEPDEALALLAKLPESEQTRHIAAKARLAAAPDDDHDATLDELLERVKDDDDARQQYVDILEMMGPDDPRTVEYRKRLTARLF